MHISMIQTYCYSAQSINVLYTKTSGSDLIYMQCTLLVITQINNLIFSSIWNVRLNFFSEVVGCNTSFYFFNNLKTTSQFTKFGVNIVTMKPTNL